MKENNSIFFIPGVVGGTFSTTLLSKKENYGGDIVDERKQLFFFIPGVVGGTFSTTFLLLFSFFVTASDFDSFSSVEFIAAGVASFNLPAATFRSSMVAARYV